MTSQTTDADLYIQQKRMSYPIKSMSCSFVDFYY